MKDNEDNYSANKKEALENMAEKDSRCVIDALGKFLEFMNCKGLNTTAQRKVIAEVFFENRGHYSLEEFYSLIADRDPSIGQTTVYRTLKLLCEAGLASEIQFADSITRFEVVKPHTHHDHMVCIKCGKIIEISDLRIETIQKEIAGQYNFVLTGHSHNLYGYCNACNKS